VVGQTRNERARMNPAPAGVIRLSTVLENYTEATSAAIDKRRLKTGITGPMEPTSPRRDVIEIGQITVKIVRAHGGCLGTKSR
jgi:hypothetical protein